MMNNANNNEYSLPADPDSFTVVNGRVYLLTPQQVEHKKLRREGNTVGLIMLLYFFFTVNLYNIVVTCIHIASPAAAVFGFSDLTKQLVTLGCYIISVVVPAAIYKFCAGEPLRFAFPARAPKPRVLFPAIFIMLGLAMCGNLAAAFFNSAFVRMGFYFPSPALQLPESLPQTVVYLSATVLLPPLLEEFLFRGVVMQSLRRFGDGLALVASAALFSLAHLDAVVLPFAFVLGLCLGYFVMRTGSLWTGIILHFANNLVSVIFNFCTADLSYRQSTIAFYIMACALIALGTAAFALLCAKNKRLFAVMPAGGEMTEKARAKSFWLSPCVVIYCIIAAVYTAMQAVAV